MNTYRVKFVGSALLSKVLAEDLSHAIRKISKASSNQIESVTLVDAPAAPVMPRGTKALAKDTEIFVTILAGPEESTTHGPMVYWCRLADDQTDEFLAENLEPVAHKERWTAVGPNGPTVPDLPTIEQAIASTIGLKQRHLIRHFQMLEGGEWEHERVEVDS